MYRTMLDLIKPKLVYLDIPLFMALLSDLFPGVELPAAEGGELRATLEADLTANGYQVVSEFVVKMIQVRRPVATPTSALKSVATRHAESGESKSESGAHTQQRVIARVPLARWNCHRVCLRAPHSQ
jgi:hypothetical protein